MRAGEAGDGNEGDPNGDLNGDPKEKNYTEYEVSTTTTTGEFLLLSLDLPPLPLPEGLDQLVGAQLGAQIDEHSLLFYGRCAACQAGDAQAD